MAVSLALFNFTTIAQPSMPFPIKVINESTLTRYQLLSVTEQLKKAQEFVALLNLNSSYPESGQLTITSDYLHFIAMQHDLWQETISHSAFYDANNQHMVVYFEHKTELLLQRIRHESIHMLLKTHYPAAPLWVHEGLAENFESYPSSKKLVEESTYNTLANTSANRNLVMTNPPRWRPIVDNSQPFSSWLEKLSNTHETNEQFYRQSTHAIRFLLNHLDKKASKNIIYASVYAHPLDQADLHTLNQIWMHQ